MVLWQQNLYETMGSERSSLRALRASWQKEYGEFQGEANGLQERFDGLVSDLDGERKARADEFTKAMQAATGRLGTLEATYEEKLALRAPVEYWSSKAKGHGRGAVWFGLLTLVLMAAAGTGLVFGFQKILGDVTDNPEWWRIGALATVVILALWVVRISVRLFLSHFHLKIDAEERAVMLNAYLALMEGGQVGIDKEDRRLILQALFRPTSTGIVKDDAAPPGAIELITRIAGK